jgi:tetratricopeptide (TPR) repeat protein
VRIQVSACAILFLVMVTGRSSAGVEAGQSSSPPEGSAAQAAENRTSATSRGNATLPRTSVWADTDSNAREAAYLDAASAFNGHLVDIKEQLRELAERKYKERRAQIEANYRRQLEPVEKAERQRRLEAIAAFEAFVERHQDDQEYLPDALFRLAELYFEKIDDDYQVAIADYRNAYQSWKDAGSTGDPPVEPTKRFDRTIALYRQLIDRFPEYRLLDGAYYLLGYTLRQQNEEDAGLDAWKTLVARFPQSKFYPEVWFRIGDSHFDNERWPEAIEAFSKVVSLQESDFFDKGLYKLAWTYYLVNKFDLAVDSFFQLLDYSWKKKAGSRSGSVLEDEAVQYVAISFGDDNWDRGPSFKKPIGSGAPDAETDFETDYVGFARNWFARASNERKPYERDVMAKLGDNLFRQSKHSQAVSALERAIELDPLHKDSPRLQDQIVQCWVRERQFDKAATARDVLVKAYGKGTPWAKHFANDVNTLRVADDLARTNLYNAAIYYHQQATAFFNAERQELGVQYFKLASDAYLEYVNRYPHDKLSYEMGYYLAETYYFSLRFEEAVRQYEATRDSTAGTSHRAESALSAVYSYEKIIDAATSSGSLEKRAITTGARDPSKAPEAVPPLLTRLIDAIDKFLVVSEQHEKAAPFGYRAGEIFYSYGQYDEGVKRFARVVELFPGSDAAKFAANLILDDLLARKDWKAAADTASRFASVKVGGSSDDYLKIQGGARFNIAKETLERGEKLMNDGKIQEAIRELESGAEQYLQLLNEDPKREFADVMMYNAALSFEKARRPIRAAGLYERLYKEYPQSEYSPEAMFRVAVKSEQAFVFDKAVDVYLSLVKVYPNSPRRSDAQINAALALEGQQQYERAAQEFERYAGLFPTNPDAPDVFYRSSVVHKKKGSAESEIGALKRFIATFGGRPGQAARAVEARVRLGDIYLEQSRKQPALKKAAVDSYKAAVDEFAKAGSPPAAARFAGKAAFVLAEDEFLAYSKLVIAARNGEKQVKELEAKSARLTEVEAVYKKIITTYKAAEWSLAALYRIGSLYGNMQQVVQASPCPDDIRRQFGDEGCDEYSNAIEDQAFAVEEKAVSAYKIAHDKAQELRVTNEWTKKTLEALNLLRPQEFPIDKEALSKASSAPVDDGFGFILPDGGSPDWKALGPGPVERQRGGGA